MKKFLSLLILLSVFTMVNPASAMTIIQKNMGYISISVNESMDITPNIANITLSVETTDIDSKRATERNNQITSKVVNALKQELISDKKSVVQTKNFNLKPNYKNTDDESNKIKNYTAINSINIKTNDISKISTLIDIAIKNNVTNISNISFSAEEYETYSNELTNKALIKAQNNAKSIACSLNQKITGIKQVRVNIYNQASNGLRVYKASSTGNDNSDALNSPPIESGKVKLNVSIDAEFYVK